MTEESEENAPYYCYIVRCSDGTLYTGITNNLERRIAVHNKGKGGAYTASRCPVELVFSELIGEKGDALRRELQIKSLTRSQKLSLINREENGRK
ncbi:MAG: GIY-YIG nuclease family protein [Anaerolineaceae bacterium]|nr:GIY-YIG nuclease family protein [Anaerolineaceae bacterium]